MIKFQKIKASSSIDYLSLYLSGYYPFYDHGLKEFYWTREPDRVIIDLRREMINRNVVKLKKDTPDGLKILINEASELVIESLADPKIKENSWVYGEVKEIYFSLKDQGILMTIEAWQANRLVGGLLGIDLHGVFLAETMYSIVNGASKLCLISLVEMTKAKGYAFIDVQTQHNCPHPAARLGETSLSILDYVKLLIKYSFTI